MAALTTTYGTVQRILDDSVGGGGSPVGSHGGFWRTQTRDQFVAGSIFGRKLIVVDASGVFDPESSALVQALEGRAPFGLDIGTPGGIFRRMPAGRTV
jgi:hypothetical protein